jgi:polysaccharide pyruvyl transferase WcaK-like protein
LRVIGCPAIYWTCDPALHLKPAAKHRPLAVALNGAANGVPHASDAAAAKAVEAKLARLSFKHGYPYFLQNEADLAAIAANLPDAFESHRIELLMDQYGLSNIGPKKFIEFVKRNTRIHFKVVEWHAAMQQFDFVVGTRFHGCLIALQAGVPCFVFPHDARTRELCELLCLPHRPVTAAGTVDVEALYENLELKALEQTYQGLYENYVCFLEENGFEHNLVSQERTVNGAAAPALS